MTPRPQGIIVIDKPAGLTSFGVVRIVRRLLGLKKVGHLGTLDPMAVGVLPLCLNEATKLTPFLIDQTKTYRATVRLGEETDTQDGTGTVTARSSRLPAPEAIAPALAGFVGEQWQTPPIYSALHFQGRRLYQYARQGISLDLAPRRITILDLTLEAVNLPELTLTVTCSKGAYIRTLAADLGRELGCGGHLQALQRLAVGPFQLSQAVCLPEAPTAQSAADLVAHCLPLADCLPHLAALQVEPAAAVQVRQGRALALEALAVPEGLAAPGEQVKIICREELVAVAVLDRQGEKIQPVRVFNP